MLKKNLLVALRNFVRQPGYTVLNILGLTIGISASMLILLYLIEELSFDKYHEKADRIYRISSDLTEPDDAFRWATTQTPLGPQLKIDYSEVEHTVRFFPQGRLRFQEKDRFFYEEDVYIVDSTVFDVFDFDFVFGDKAASMKEPNSIVLNQSLSKRIFGESNPIGGTLKLTSGREYIVKGVYKDMPPNSHIIANAMVSSNTFPQLSNPNAGSWGGFSIYTYVLLKEGSNAEDFAAKLPEVIENYVAVIFDQFDIKIKYELINLTDIHLYSDFEGEPVPTGEIGFIYIFSAVALFLLLLACINYMNLSTARATKRALEVGVRKVLGSDRLQLIFQFLTESLLFAIVSIALSFLLLMILIPFFNDTFDLELRRSLLLSSGVLWGALAIILIVGILGGSYPAFYLSAFRPIKVLKGLLSKGSGNPMLRKVLVTVQFAVTIFMLIGTGIIYDQMQYLREKDLGFDKEHVLTFQLDGQESRERFQVIRDKLLQNPKITSVGTSSTSPGQGFGKLVASVEGADGTIKSLGVDNYFVDFDFFPTMGMELTAGRYFSREYSTDSTQAVMVNEAMVKRMAWDDPIGRRVRFSSNDTLPFLRVIGVVKDFHQASLYDPIEALVFRPAFNLGNVHVRINPQSPQDISAIIASTEQVWQEIFPNKPFEYDFLDSSFMELYQADQVRGRIFSLFSLLMIVIACLGLLGLASFTTEQRTKEIGIRKVIGAKTVDILVLLTRNFVLLVVLGAIPAFLAAWYFMKIWLDTFSYHANMNFWLYGLALLTVVALTIFTTGYFAIRAAQRNPVKALKYE